jgi:hypothetical protein
VAGACHDWTTRAIHDATNRAAPGTATPQSLPDTALLPLPQLTGELKPYQPRTTPQHCTRAFGARREGRPQRSLAGHAGHAQLAQARVAGRRRRQLRALEAHRAHHLPHSIPSQLSTTPAPPQNALPPVTAASMAWGPLLRGGGHICAAAAPAARLSGGPAARPPAPKQGECAWQGRKLPRAVQRVRTLPPCSTGGESLSVTVDGAVC